MILRPIAAVFVLAPGLALALAPVAHAAAQEQAPPTIERIESRDGNVFEAELGEVEVPERRGGKAARTITLTYMRVKSPAAAPGSPVFLLAGGPGGSAIEQVRRHVGGGGKAWLEMMGGDVVGIDQRGVGLSRPNLDSDTLFPLPLETPGDPEALLAAIQQVCQQEAARWREQGVDLSGYTTTESADDIADVARHLGYDKLSLWGESYGTHLALATIRRHEALVDRAVLVGAEGPDHTLKLPSQAQLGLERIAKLVASEPGLGEQIPDLVAMVTRVIDKLELAPVQVEVDGQSVGLSAFDAQWLLSNLIGTTHGGIDRVPALVLAMDQGDYAPFARELAELRGSFGVGSAMTWMMDCSSGASKGRATRIAKESKTCVLGGWVDFPHPGVAEAWGAPDEGNAFRAPLKAKTPVLFLIGDLDSRTPVSNAEELMKGLPNAKLIVVENAAHDVNWMQPELREVWVGFLAGEQGGAGKAGSAEGAGDGGRVGRVVAGRPRFLGVGE